MKSEDALKYTTQYNWCVMGPLYRRNACIAAGPWDIGISASEDLLYEAKIKTLGMHGKFVNEVLATWHIHDKSNEDKFDPIKSAKNSETVACRLSEILLNHKIINHRPWNDIARYFLRAGLILGASGDKASMQKCLKSATSNARGVFKILCYTVGILSLVIPVGILNIIAHRFAKLNFLKYKK